MSGLGQLLSIIASEKAETPPLTLVGEPIVFQGGVTPQAIPTKIATQVGDTVVVSFRTYYGLADRSQTFADDTGNDYSIVAQTYDPTSQKQLGIAWAKVTTASSNLQVKINPTHYGDNLLATVYVLRGPEVQPDTSAIFFDHSTVTTTALLSLGPISTKSPGFVVVIAGAYNQPMVIKTEGYTIDSSAGGVAGGAWLSAHYLAQNALSGMNFEIGGKDGVADHIGCLLVPFTV